MTGNQGEGVGLSDDFDGLTTDHLLGLYRRLLLLRRFEDRVYHLFLQGELAGTLHQYQGQ